MSRLKKPAFWTGLMVIIMLNLATAQAAMVGTPEIVTETQRTELIDALNRQDVQQQLVDMGVDPDAAIKRVSNMNTEELAELNGQLDTLPAGAGLSNVELLLIIIIIILIL